MLATVATVASITIEDERGRRDHADEVPEPRHGGRHGIGQDDAQRLEREGRGG
jgi:hypothetical protein